MFGYFYEDETEGGSCRCRAVKLSTQGARRRWRTGLAYPHVSPPFYNPTTFSNGRAKPARKLNPPTLRFIPFLSLMAAASGIAGTFSVRPTAPAGRRPCSCAAATGEARFRGADGSGGGKWWAPLLGWSDLPDYIDAQPAPAPQPEEERTGQIAYKPALTFFLAMFIQQDSTR